MSITQAMQGSRHHTTSHSSTPLFFPMHVMVGSVAYDGSREMQTRRGYYSYYPHGVNRHTDPTSPHWTVDGWDQHDQTFNYHYTSGNNHEGFSYDPHTGNVYHILGEQNRVFIGNIKGLYQPVPNLPFHMTEAIAFITQLSSDLEKFQKIRGVEGFSTSPTSDELTDRNRQDHRPRTIHGLDGVKG